VKTDYDRHANLERYRTYAIQPGPVALSDSTTPDTIVQDRIGAALRRELHGKGMAPAATAAKPDMIVTYAASSKPHREWIETASTDPHWSCCGYQFFSREVERGALVIDVLDGASRKLVWRAIAKAEDKEFASEPFIDQAVAKALRKFPEPRS
jgi:hypothetical protein